MAQNLMTVVLTAELVVNSLDDVSNYNETRQELTLEVLKEKEVQVGSVTLKDKYLKKYVVGGVDKQTALNMLDSLSNGKSISLNGDVLQMSETSLKIMMNK